MDGEPSGHELMFAYIFQIRRPHRSMGRISPIWESSSIEWPPVAIVDMQSMRNLMKKVQLIYSREIGVNFALSFSNNNTEHLSV